VGELAKKVFEAFRASSSERVDDRAREAVMPLDQTPESMASMADLTALNDHPPRSMHQELGEDVCPVAVKVWSAILGDAIWVVADDLPKDAWPVDALAYKHQEVKMLRQIGQDTLAWVHATKQMFGAQVIAGGRRPGTQLEPPCVRHSLDQPQSSGSVLWFHPSQGESELSTPD
jgi:hypothetical protein